VPQQMALPDCFCFLFEDTHQERETCLSFGNKPINESFWVVIPTAGQGRMSCVFFKYGSLGPRWYQYHGGLWSLDTLKPADTWRLPCSSRLSSVFDGYSLGGGWASLFGNLCQIYLTLSDYL
jgi:hypothetical protein